MKLQDLVNAKPTKQWHERMVQYGDELFTQERLDSSDRIIDKYLNELLQVNADQGKIMSLVEEIVVSFNCVE